MHRQISDTISSLLQVKEFSLLYENKEGDVDENGGEDEVSEKTVTSTS